MEMDQVYLDESVCPAGCDKKLYNLAFELRNQRHLIEQNVRRAKDDIQALNTKGKSFEKNINEIDGTLTIENENLIKFTVSNYDILTNYLSNCSFYLHAFTHREKSNK